MNLAFIIIVSFMSGAYAAFAFVSWRMEAVLGKQGRIEFMKKFKGGRSRDCGRELI